MASPSPFDAIETMTFTPDPAITATVQKLIAAHTKPGEWLFVPIDDWNDPSFRAVREQVRDWHPDAGLMFKAAVNASGTKGTAMRIGRWNPRLRTVNEDSLTF